MAASQEVQETMALDLGALLDDGDGAIVTLVAGDTRLVAHSAVLASRSPVFAAMFSHDTLEASSGQVAIPDVEAPVLRQLLAYLYTLQAPKLVSTVPQLLAAADKYSVSNLKAQCEQLLAKHLTVENAAETAVLAVRHSCSSLKQAAFTFIKTRALKVMATQGWADAMREQPEDLIEVSRLLSDPPAETSAPATTATRTAGTPCQTHSRTPATAAPSTAPLDEAAVSHMRSLSAADRGERLIQAAKKGAVGEVRALLAAGADVGAWEEPGAMTALHWAAEMGYVQVATCLLEAGALVDARDSQQNTPLNIAAFWGHMAVVQLLLVWSADPNARDNEGRTPLHEAAQYRYPEVTAALLEAGANRGARTNKGETPLALATQFSVRDLIRFGNKQRVVRMLL